MTAGADRYPLALRLLHGATAALVVGQVLLAAVNAAVYEQNPAFAERVVQAHLSLGAVVFCVTGIRLVWRLSVPLPALPGAMSKLARAAARAVHALLYALLLVLPVSGYVKLAALGYQVLLFGILPLPVLPFDPVLAASAKALHAGSALLLGLLIAGHIGAAVFHRWLFGQPVLARMFGRRAPSAIERRPAPG